MTRMQSCWNRFLWIVAVLLAISGCFQRSTVSSLSARPPRRNHHCTHSQQSIDDPLPQNGGVSRRDWLVAGACSGLLWSNNHAAAAADSQPRLAPEYYDPSNVVTDPSAGRSYFPALTPPFFDRATYKYTLGRNTWALEQLLTFANVTATIRTTVVKLQSTGGLWVHSPQWPTGEFCALLESIGGPVEHVVLPCNAFEHKAPLQAFVERYPNAKVWIAPGQYGPLGSCGITLSDKNNRPQMGYKVDGILGDANSPPPPWSDEFDIATLYIDLPRNAGPVSEVAFCHRPTKTLVTTDAVVYVPETPSGILETYFDKETLEIANFWPRSVLQAVFLPLREEQGRYPGYEALVNKLARAPILRAVVDARAPNAVRDWILEQTTTTKFLDGSKHWDYDRVVTSHFASPIEATPSDVRASFAYLLDEDLSSNSSNSKNSLPPIACQDWELLDSINQFIAKYNAGEPAVFDFQRGCVAELRLASEREPLKAGCPPRRALNPTPTEEESGMKLVMRLSSSSSSGRTDATSTLSPSSRVPLLVIALAFICLAGIYNSNSSLSSMTVSSLPSSITYYMSETLDTTNEILELSYNNSTKKKNNHTDHEKRKVSARRNSTVNATRELPTTAVHDKLRHNNSNINRNATNELPASLVDTIRVYMDQPVESRPKPPNTPGALLHVGKAGGSTLVSVLRNGCHSFRPKPCKTLNAHNETYLSALTTYVHTPDFDRLGTDPGYSGFGFYVATVRDPFTKLQSAFTYTHPDNGLRGVKSRAIRKACKQYYTCFPSLERFSELVGDDPLDFDYPYPRDTINVTNCTNLARASLANRNGACTQHLYWNTKSILERIPGWTNTHQTSSSSPPLMVIRAEHNDQDFKKANAILGDPHPVELRDAGAVQGRIQKVYNVTKDISVLGRKRLCSALLPEYKAYVLALEKAINLSEEDKRASLEWSREMCPDLQWLFRKDLLTTTAVAG